MSDNNASGHSPLGIRFAHNYAKLYGQKSARLLDVILIARDDINFEAVNYDTSWFDEVTLGIHYFELENGEYLRLTFIGDKGIPFTTYRKNTPENSLRYLLNIGEEFVVFVKRFRVSHKVKGNRLVCDYDGCDEDSARAERHAAVKAYGYKNVRFDETSEGDFEK